MGHEGGTGNIWTGPHHHHYHPPLSEYWPQPHTTGQAQAPLPIATKASPRVAASDRQPPSTPYSKSWYHKKAPVALIENIV